MSAPPIRGRLAVDTIDEARFLLSCGESIFQTASILGISVDSLSKAAWKTGASDVAEAITAAKKAASEYRHAA